MNQQPTSPGKVGLALFVGILVLIGLQYLLPVALSFFIPFSPPAAPNLGFSIINTIVNLISALGATLAGLLVGYWLGHKGLVYGAWVGIIAGLIMIGVGTIFSLRAGAGQLPPNLFIQALIPGLGNVIDLVILSSIGALAGEYLKASKSSISPVVTTAPAIPQL